MTARHVLIVDDIKDARVLIRLMLSSRGGFTISEAAGGAEALTLAAATHPDLIILDYMMPDMDGIDVCRAIRATPETAALPVLMLTARADLGIHEKALAAGANFFMNKPVRPADLAAAVTRLIDEAERARAVSGF